MSLNNSNINGHLVPETISLKESEVILTYNTDNNFYSLKENLTVIPESSEEYLDYIVTEGKDIITYDKSSGLIKIKEGVTEGFGIITIKSKFPTKVKAELKIYVTKSQTIEIFGNIYHIDKYGSLYIDDRELKEVGKVKSIKVYNKTVYAITLDNRLYAWGDNSSGQVGNGSTEYQTTPYEIKEVGKVKSIEVYENEYAITVYAITLDNRLYAWGNNKDGEVGNGKSGDKQKQTTPYEIKEVGKVKSIEVGSTVYAITEDNRLYAWGNNRYGQVCNGKSGLKEKQTTPYEIKEVGKVKSIEVGFRTAYAITEDDRLYTWGYNEYGEVGNGKSGDEDEQTTPYEIKEVGKVKSIKVNFITAYAITEDDKLYAWGYNSSGQVGNGESGYEEKQTTPYEIKEVGKVKSVVEYGFTVYAITEDDTLYAWGYNIQNTPYEFKEIGKIKSFEEKEGNFYLSTIDDRLFTWGEDGKVGKCAIPYEIKEVEAYKWVEEYNGTIYAITEDDRLYAWGSNYRSQVGNGSTKPQTTPYEIKEVGKVKSIKVYEDEDEEVLTIYVITEDDRLYAWGNTSRGQVGNGKSGDEEKQTIPYEIKEVGKVKSIEVYNDTIYAITEDDRLYAWGYNEYGQVGNGKSGDEEEQTKPYEVKEIGKIKSIEVYNDTVYAITLDNRLYAWGNNEDGEVGNGKSGDEEKQTTPYEVKEVGKVKSIKVYEYYNYIKKVTVYAITEDDRLYAWGNNWYGQVGNGKSGYEEKQTTPYELKEVGKVKSIKVYEDEYAMDEYAITVYAITLDNRLYAWGNNWYGQVGNGSTKPQTTPYELKEVGKVKSIEVYNDTIYAITEDDRLYAWGYNEYGEVGNGKSGDEEKQTTPYEIKEVGKVKSIKVYQYEYAIHEYATVYAITVYAITEDDRLYAWGDNIQNTPYEFKEIGKIKSFEEKEGNFYLSTIDDKLFTWGKDGKVGNGAIPYEIKEVEAYKWLEEYNGTFYGITLDNRLYAWGDNSSGQVGNGKSGDEEKQITQYEIKEVGKIKSIEVYEVKDKLTVYAITEDDRLYAWGNNYWGQVGNGKSGYHEKQTTPYEIKEVGKVKSIKVYKNKFDLTIYAITEDDRLYAWGDNIQNKPYEFKEIGKIKSFEEKEGNFYLSTIDDKLFTWGKDGKVGNGAIPYEIKEVEAYKWIEEYNGTFYAITEDDRLYAWGDNDYGQIGSFFSVKYDETTPYEIKEVGKVKSIKVYYEYAIDEYAITVYAITEDDRLYAWGYNIQNTPYEFEEIGKIKSFEEKEGNFCLSTIDDRLFSWGKDSKVGNGAIPYEIKEVEAYKWEEEYDGTIYAITEDDRLYAWGNNRYGEVGNGSTKPQTTPYEIKEVGKVKSLKEYDGTVYAITEDNRLYAWGYNSLGEVGNGKSGDDEIQTTPYEIKEVGKVKSIEVGYQTVYAITEDNRLYAWGYNSLGEVGNGKSGDEEKQTTPYEIKEVGKVKSIKVRFGTAYAITEDDRLYAWGNNRYGQVGNGKSGVEEKQTTPYEIKEVGKVKSIKVGFRTAYAITEDDRLYAWGYNSSGQVGNGESGYEEEQTTPYEIKEVGKVKLIEVYEYKHKLTVYTITEDDRLYAWGKNIQNTPYEFKEIGKIKSFEEKEGNFYLTTIDDRSFTWGEDSKVGNGAIPYEIKEVEAYKWVEEYNGTFYAITEDDRLYAWGSNYFGQVGNGSSKVQITPYEIKEVGKVKSIEVYNDTAYAITEDNRLYAWGYNSLGQVGNGKSGDEEKQITPYEVKEVGKVKSIEVYNYTVYAITLDDRLYAWCNNSRGQVGNGSIKLQTTPYEIKEVGKVKSIKVYEYEYTITLYAITEDNRLYAWGSNHRGQVGNGSTEEQTTPYEVKEVGKVRSIKVYQYEYAITVYAITEDDRLYAWGSNHRGQVGNGSTDDETTPYEIKEVGKVKSLKEYDGTAYAITEDDRLYAWGDNSRGQVGNGESDYYEEQTTPYEIKEVGKVKSLKEYDGTAYAITEDDRLYAWGDNIQNTPYEFKEIGKIKSFEEKEGNFYLTTIDDRLFTWGKDSKLGNGAIPYNIKEVE